MSRSRMLWPLGTIAVTLASGAVVAGCTDCGHHGDVTSASDPTDAMSIFPPDAPADDPTDKHFQGVIETMIHHVTDVVDPQNVDEVLEFQVKGDAYRWNLLESNIPRGDYRIYDRSAHTFYTVLKSEGLILSTRESEYLVDSGGGPIAHYDLVDENTTGNVQGHSCEMYRVIAPPYRFEMCATGDFIPIPFHMMPGIYQATMPFGAELESRNLFPLYVNQILMTDAGVADIDAGGHRGTMVNTFRVRRIEPQRIDPAIFKIPTYTMRRTQLLQTTGKLAR